MFVWGTTSLLLLFTTDRTSNRSSNHCCFHSSSSPPSPLLPAKAATASSDDEDHVDNNNIEGYIVRELLSCDDASTVLDEIIMPKREYGKRLRLGRDAQDFPEGQVVLASDPSLSYTYGEFPLRSLDILLDAACQYLDCNDIEKTIDPEAEKESQQPINTSGNDQNLPLNVIDLGSGCGRLCLYLALTRWQWNVAGIEIAQILHDEAIEALNRMSASLSSLSQNSKRGYGDDDDYACTISLLQGDAREYGELIQEADLMFCYSTAMESSGFSEQTGSMILSNEWNQLLTSHCREGCVVVTTDRSLDPSLGWKILERLDVDNPEVFGSVGYIQKLTR